MNPILLTVIILSSIGLLSGLILSIAAIVMAVKRDETADMIEQILPGANCGSCGFSGCSGYAAALAKGETDNTSLCSPGGAAVASAIAEALGLENIGFVEKHAVVRCRGNSENTQDAYEYDGLPSCAAASRLFGGAGACRYGCIGLGDCVGACDFGAIKIENSLAVVDTDKCGGCGKCAKACPKGVIEIVPSAEAFTVRCVSHDKGALVRKICKAGCIGCSMCVRACEHGAVSISDFCAQIDPEKCIGCGKCVVVCPQKCIN